MARRLSLDTSILIDLQREGRRGREDGSAQTFLNRNDDSDLYLSVVALAEFAEGVDDFQHPSLTMVRDMVNVLPVDEETCLLYAGVARDLRRRGNTIGANDLWIGATALRHQLPIVTSNVDDFSRIDGLEVISYRAPSA